MQYNSLHLWHVFNLVLISIATFVAKKKNIKKKKTVGKKTLKFAMYTPKHKFWQKTFHVDSLVINVPVPTVRLEQYTLSCIPLSHIFYKHKQFLQLSLLLLYFTLN